MKSHRLILALLMLLPSAAVAQRDDFLSRSSLMLQGGGMNYTGDLNDQSILSTPHLAYGGGLRYDLNNRWSFRAAFSKGAVSASDYNELRNLSFRSNIYEFSAAAEFSFWNFGLGATDRRWAFFIYAGVAAFHFNPKTSYTLPDGTEEWAELQPLCTEGQGSTAYPERRPYRLTQLAIPFGIGAKFKLGKTVWLAVEYGLRKTWTDYLDDVSTTYVGAEVLSTLSDNGELAAQLADRSGEVREGYVNAPGIKRGDDSLDDLYASFNVSIGFSLETLLGWTRSKRCKL